jgi:hypothetical protein
VARGLGGKTLPRAVELGGHELCFQCGKMALGCVARGLGGRALPRAVELGGHEICLQCGKMALGGCFGQQQGLGEERRLGQQQGSARSAAAAGPGVVAAGSVGGVQGKLSVLTKWFGNCVRMFLRCESANTDVLVGPGGMSVWSTVVHAKHSIADRSTSSESKNSRHRLPLGPGRVLYEHLITRIEPSSVSIVSLASQSPGSTS